jgi:hypothetical protein
MGRMNEDDRRSRRESRVRRRDAVTRRPLLAQLRENWIDLEIALKDEDDWSRLAELQQLLRETRKALARAELREVRR